ncbi:MAG: hypothetical protein JNM81_13430 [Rhodospirillaceae bacterium]|nr:hypothetical protein [Rhodospirillaceae bacterium]
MARRRILSKLGGRMTLREELELIGSQIAHLSERTLGEGHEKLNEEVEHLKGTFEELLERAHDTAASGLDSLGERVQERPVESLLGAFAAGAILAALLVRR